MIFVMSFGSTHAALSAKKRFEEAADVRRAPSASIVPTPKQIDAGCGMALRFECKTPEEALNLLVELKISCKDTQIYTEISEDKLHFSPLTPPQTALSEVGEEERPQDKISHKGDTE